MTAHWKYGEGYAIRYGGKSDIKWFRGDEYESLKVTQKPYEPPPGIQANGAMMVISAITEALKVAAMFLQWNEMRKSNSLQSAAFEERRHQWLADLLAVLSSELENGDLRSDTIRYLDRECTNLIQALSKNPLMDVPSTLLLQIERFTTSIININTALDQIIYSDAPNFVLIGAGKEKTKRYTPHYEKTKTDDILELANFSDSIIREIGALPVIFSAACMPTSITKTISSMLGLFKDTTQENIPDRNLQEFSSILHLQIELRSCLCQLSLTSKMDERIVKIT